MAVTMIFTARRLCPLFAALTAILFISGCKPAPENSDTSTGFRDPSGLVIPVPLLRHDKPASRKIALCLANVTDPHQRVQVNLLADALRAADDSELAFTDARGSVAAQKEQLRAIAATKPTAVMVLPVKADEISDEIAALKAAGARVIGLDASLNDGRCDSVVYCDQKKIGMMAGNLIVAALERRAKDGGATEVTGRVVQIQGDDDHPACRARSDGFLSALKARPGIILVHDVPAKWDKAEAGLRFKEALKLQKIVDAVYAHNDMMALGVSEASSAELNIRQELLIIGTDGITGPGAGLEMLSKGQIDATVHQPLLVDFAWRLLEKMEKEKDFKPHPAYEIEPVVFTPNNQDELKAKGLPVPSF